MNEKEIIKNFKSDLKSLLEKYHAEVEIRFLKNFDSDTYEELHLAWRLKDLKSEVFIINHGTIVHKESNILKLKKDKFKDRYI